MPTATCRLSPGVLSFQLALVVAGGYTPSHSYKTTVEIFKSDTSQWYKTDPLPTAYQDISLAIHAMHLEDTMAHGSTNLSMSQLMISLEMLYQPTRPPTVVATVAERGRAFYFHNFQKRSFPIMIISDYEYFSLLKFFDTDFSHHAMKPLSGYLIRSKLT